MEYKSHRIKRTNIPQGKKLLYLDNKNRYVALGQWGLCGASLLTPWPLLALPMGFLASITTFRKGKVLFEGYDNFFVYFQGNDPNYCEIIYLDEVLNWEYRITKQDNILLLVLQEHEKICISNMRVPVYRYCREVMPDREVRRKPVNKEKQ